MKNKFTILLICQNEEKRIKKFLDEAKKVTDDIVIVHDGPCTDRTLDIAKKYSKKVYEEELTKAPEFLKVKYLNLNKKKKIFKYEYIFLLDTDEFISKELKKELDNLNLKDYDFYRIKIQAHDQNYKEAKFYSRLFNVNKIKYFGFYHTAAIPKNNKTKKYDLKKVINHDKYIHKQRTSSSGIFWVKLEAIKLYKKEYNYYNFSKNEIKKQERTNKLRQSIILRILAIFYLFPKYSVKYSPKMAIRRLESQIRLTKYIFIVKKHFIMKKVIKIINKIRIFSLNLFVTILPFNLNKTKEVIITIDDNLNQKHSNLIKLMNKDNIPAVFFIPFEYLDESRKILNKNYNNKSNYEIGWHGYYHDYEEFERNYEDSIKLSLKEIKKNNIISSRFPFLRFNQKALDNLEKTSIKINSSKPNFFPIKDFKINKKFNQIPFLRLPPNGSMDLEAKKFKTISKYILRISKLNGTLVLAFHIDNLNKNKKEFLELINKLKSKGFKFKTFKDH